MNLHRQNGEQRRSWLQRVGVGKDWSANFQIVLPDAIYVGLALRHTMKGERVQIAKQYLLENSNVEAELAEYKIQELKWDRLKEYSEACMESPKTYRCDMRMMGKLQRMFFFEEAMKMGMPKIPSRITRKSAGSFVLVCMLCKKAGLRGRLIAHRTEECDPRLRLKNVEKLQRKSAQKKRNIVDLTSGQKKRRRDPPARAAQLECKNCKAQGRKHWHDPKECKYAPGGAWHGLKGEKLKEAQRKTYQDSRAATKTSKTLEGDSSRKNRSRPIKKMRASALKNKDGSGKPYWMLKCHAALQDPTQFDGHASDVASAVNYQKNEISPESHISEEM